MSYLTNPYRYVVGETQTCYGQPNGGTINGANVSSGAIMSNAFSTGSDPVGNVLESCTFNCTTTDNSVDHALSARVYEKTTDNVVATSTNTINNNTLNQNASPGVGDFTEMSFTFAGTYTIRDGDRIGIKNDGSGFSLKQAQEDGYTSANPELQEANAAGVWETPQDTHQIMQCVTWS